ncbi:MAG: DUF4350 domain-containing protein [Opitutaceae bacterium]
MSLIDSFRVSRWIRTVNLVLQAVLFFTLFSGLNYLAENHGWEDGPWRIDLTRSHRFSLAPETLAYLKSLSRPVRIVVTRRQSAVRPDLRGLLDEYAYATQANPEGAITVRYLDVDLQRSEAQQLGLDEPDRVALFCGDGPPLIVPIADLYRYGPNGPAAFNGEAVLTGALLDISNPDRQKIYFLAGQGELQPGDVDADGLSMAADLLRQRGFAVDTLDLSAAAAIPEDAALVISVSPRVRYSPREQEILRRYLSRRDGRFILFAGPGEPLGLDALLSDWGVRVDNDLVLDSGRDHVTEDGDLIVRAFATHPITRALFSASPHPRLRFGPAARPVRTDPAKAAASGLEVVTLAATSRTAWGEFDPAARHGRAFDPAVDIRPSPRSVPPDRLGLAVASTRARARDNLPFSVASGRIVVVGCGDLIDNRRIDGEGVFDFLIGAVNWAVDRDRELTIPPRPLDRFQLSLSARELQNLRYAFLLLVPGLAAALGLMVYWSRRT